jgi:hypothetical protein
MKFKVIVAGGRRFDDYELLKECLDMLLMLYVLYGYKIVIISGTAKGADKLGERYAKERGYGLIRMPADWSIGKSAGYRRNADMADIADASVCFFDGESRGTGHMINLSKSKGLDCRVVEYEQEEINEANQIIYYGL